LNLHFNKYGSGPALVILHGLFGSADNWHTLARRWSNDYTVYALDQRNHGSSPHESSMKFEELSQDLCDFLNQHGIESAHLLGHSMGGKVAMDFATKHAERVKTLIVIDIGLETSTGKHESVLEVLANIEPEEFASRQSLESSMKLLVSSSRIRQFLLKNVLRKIDGSLGWKFNRDALLDCYNILVERLNLQSAFMGPTYFLRGSESDYLAEDLDPEILQFFPLAQLTTIKGAGHWVHVDAPDALYKKVVNYCL
jgi:pimeloyl-ACP methyl ester carboxylesterase